MVSESERYRNLFIEPSRPTGKGFNQQLAPSLPRRLRDIFLTMPKACPASKYSCFGRLLVHLVPDLSVHSALLTIFGLAQNSAHPSKTRAGPCTPCWQFDQWANLARRDGMQILLADGAQACLDDMEPELCCCCCHDALSSSVGQKLEVGYETRCTLLGLHAPATASFKVGSTLTIYIAAQSVCQGERKFLCLVNFCRRPEAELGKLLCWACPRKTTLASR